MTAEFSYDNKRNFINAKLKDGTNDIGTATITYDNKNAPFVNVSGWNHLRFTGGAPLGDNVDFQDIMGIRNNPIKLTGDMGGENVEVNYTYEFKDSKNPSFPTKITLIKKTGANSEPLHFLIIRMSHKYAAAYSSLPFRHAFLASPYLRWAQSINTRRFPASFGSAP